MLNYLQLFVMSLDNLPANLRIVSSKIDEVRFVEYLSCSELTIAYVYDSTSKRYKSLYGIKWLAEQNANLMFFILDKNSRACDEYTKHHLDVVSPRIVFYNRLDEFSRLFLRNKWASDRLVKDAKKAFSLKENEELFNSKKSRLTHIIHEGVKDITTLHQADWLISSRITVLVFLQFDSTAGNACYEFLQRLSNEYQFFQFVSLDVRHKPAHKSFTKLTIDINSVAIYREKFGNKNVPKKFTTAEENKIQEYLEMLFNEPILVDRLATKALNGIFNIENIKLVELLTRYAFDVVLLVYNSLTDAQYYSEFVDLKGNFPGLRFMALDVKNDSRRKFGIRGVEVRIDSDVFRFDNLAGLVSFLQWIVDCDKIEITFKDHFLQIL